MSRTRLEPKNTPLNQSLIHDGEKITAQKLERIIATLTDNKTKELSLIGCEIRPTQIEIIIAALPRNRSLEKLDLSFTGLTNKEAWILTQALAKNTSLQTINLEGNNVSAIFQKTIESMLQNRPKFTYKRSFFSPLQVEDNYFPSSSTPTTAREEATELFLLRKMCTIS
jgi:hypothetical protein